MAPIGPSDLLVLAGLLTSAYTIPYSAPWGVLDYTLLAFISLSSIYLFRRFTSGGKVALTPLNGPPSPSWFFGHYKTVQDSDSPAQIYEKWEREYGPAYIVKGGFGSQKVIICDPKAHAHFYARETYGYVQTKLARIFIQNLFGRGLLWAEGDSHKRQRKALTPAFSNAAIRRLTAVFYDSAYKMKAIWETKLDSSPEQLIDVQTWMNRISLDSIGISGFSHDFHALDGAHSPVVDVFESFGNTDHSFLSRLIFLLGPVFPILQKIPTERGRMLKRLRNTMGGIADVLLERSRKEKEGGGADKSIIGLLIKAENEQGVLGMSQEEILAQMVGLLMGADETKNVLLQWALIELCRKPEKQKRLREELAEFTGTDPSWEQLNSSLPYLDAVVHEVLRLHPPVKETNRVATEDDIIPFSRPLTTRTGETTTQLIIPKGTAVTAPIIYLNESEIYWGPNAAQFEPERWLGDAPGPKEVVAHRHLLTFSDGPRICLGRGFALAEFKAVLSVLIRNYTFELPEGPDTPIEIHRSILNRPKLRGMKSAVVNLKVRRAE
ncbi:cytochrome P450 [Cyathus striatus]|nr:cytochrome P450 [Cyathus striatus]